MDAYILDFFKRAQEVYRDSNLFGAKKCEPLPSVHKNLSIHGIFKPSILGEVGLFVGDNGVKLTTDISELEFDLA